MTSALYIFGVNGQQPYKIGSAANIRRRYLQLIANDKTIIKLGINFDPGECQLLTIWSFEHSRAPLGLELEILRYLHDHRLCIIAPGKNGTIRRYFTEWIDLPIEDLRRKIESHPWMVNHHARRTDCPNIFIRSNRAKKRPESADDEAADHTFLPIDRNSLRLLDLWIASLPDPRPSRPEAIRKLLQAALTPSSDE